MRGSTYRRGATWTAHVTWRHHGERKQRKIGGYPTRKAAEEALTAMLRAVDLGIAVPVDVLTVEQFLDGWLDHLAHVVGRKPSTVHGYRVNLRRYVVPEIGDHRVQRVTTADLDRIYRGMARRGLSARTIRLTHSIIRKALGDAERQGVVPVNVAAKASPPSSTASKPPTFPTWTWEELARFLAFIEGHAHAEALTFAALTGARRGEVCGLRWSDVDLDAGRAVISHTITDVGGELVAGTTKAHRERPVALDDHLVAVLRRHRVAQAAWRLQVGRYWHDLDLRVPGPDGSPMKPATLTQQFDRLVQAAGLPRIRFHDLRHTHATLLVADGEDPKLVSERLGHATVAFTLDRYVKVSTERQAEAANRFAARLGVAR